MVFADRTLQDENREVLRGGSLAGGRNSQLYTVLAQRRVCHPTKVRDLGSSPKRGTIHFFRLTKRGYYKQPYQDESGIYARGASEGMR